MNQVKWLADRTYLWSRSILHLRRSDTILAGYPKTGSTWIRYFLYQLLKAGGSEWSDTLDSMNRAMPEFAHRSFFAEWPFPHCQRLVKTHQRFLPFFSGKKTVLVVRDPRDIVISYFHYLNGLKDVDFTDDLSAIIRHSRMGLRSFFRHYQSWQPHTGLIIRYEDLKAEPLRYFSDLADFLRIAYTPERLALASQRAEFANMRKAQNESERLTSEFKEGHQFVRSGQKAQWEKLFTAEDRRLYDHLCQEYGFDLYS